MRFEDLAMLMIVVIPFLLIAVICWPRSYRPNKER